MAKSSYTVKPPNIFGQIGQEMGRGLAESIPREAKHARLSQGLQQFEREAGNLTPIQQLTRLAGIPGALDYPQLIQSYGNLAQQQQRGQALTDLAKQQNQPPQPQPSPFPIKNMQGVQSTGKEIPSITKEEPLAKIQQGYIPKTQDQILEDAGQRYNENPALYGNDPQKAIAAAEEADLREQKRNEAYSRQHENLLKIQENVVNRLQAEAQRLGAAGTVPNNVYTKIEDKAIQATKPKSEGGDGLTEQQAMKLYGKELDDVAREYKDINSLSGWSITGKKPSESLRSLKAIQQKFEKRDDTENLADTFIAKIGLSPNIAYQIAQPVSSVPELNNFIRNLPDLGKTISFKRGFPERAPNEKSIEKTKQILPQLAEIIKNNPKASPLAISEELKRKNYDPETFMQYLVDHREELNLKEKQALQLNKGRNFYGTLNDWWLSEWTGIK